VLPKHEGVLTGAYTALKQTLGVTFSLRFGRLAHAFAVRTFVDD
jgi:hypothetical protein